MFHFKMSESLSHRLMAWWDWCCFHFNIHPCVPALVHVSQRTYFIKSIKRPASRVAGMEPYPEAYGELMIVQMSTAVILKPLTGCMI